MNLNIGTFFSIPSRIHRKSAETEMSCIARPKCNHALQLSHIVAMIATSVRGQLFDICTASCHILQCSKDTAKHVLSQMVKSCIQVPGKDMCV